MPLLKAAGKAVRWGTKRATSDLLESRLATGVILGGAFAGGGLAAATDPEGPYAPVQEELFGYRNTVRHSMRAGLSTAMSNNDEVRYGPMGSYYGRPYNPTGGRYNASSGSYTPVPGDIVFGQYNLRRGGR